MSHDFVRSPLNPGQDSSKPMAVIYPISRLYYEIDIHSNLMHTLPCMLYIPHYTIQMTTNKPVDIIINTFLTSLTLPLRSRFYSAFST